MRVLNIVTSYTLDCLLCVASRLVCSILPIAVPIFQIAVGRAGSALVVSPLVVFGTI